MNSVEVHCQEPVLHTLFGIVFGDTLCTVQLYLHGSHAETSVKTQSPLESKGNGGLFLICRRARRQRSQSPILVTVRIDKHFGLYKRLEPKRKINEFPISLSSDGVDEQIPFDSPISKKESGNFTIQQLKRPSPMVVGISK